MRARDFLWVAWMMGAAGCGDDAGAEACARFAETSCATDEACNYTQPCTVSCEDLGEPEDPEALEACVDEYEAIALPDSSSDPLGHVQACIDRSFKQIDCLTLF